jgi:alkylation response protein AidB-like acyl-CoA dehydrogenase
MDLELSAEDRAFREKAATWLHEHVPKERRPEDYPAAWEFDRAWQRAQYDGGWAGISWPAEFAGLGLSLLRQMLWFEQYAIAGGPFIGSCFVGINHAGPTLIHNASPDLQAEHLPPILRGDLTWCQGFSEPGAGSDLAGIRTRAVIDGDDLVVTGSKIWTSYAHVARYQELIVRTDPDSVRHKGLTWVICDMTLPGVTIRPIELINNTMDFCEVFYDEARIPLTNVVGGIGNGWATAMSTLSFERGTGFMAEQVDLARVVEELHDLAKERPGPGGRRRAIDNDDIAERLGYARAEVAALRAMTYASVSETEKTGVPSASGSMIRFYFGELNQRVQALAMDIMGTDSLGRDESVDYGGPAYLWAWASTVGGGTADIQRNIVAQRVLGLPR